MHTKKELDARLSVAGIQPIKKLGQNFLVNEPVCRKIIAAAQSFSPQSVLEIGPGLGALTDEFIKWGSQLTLIEYDSGLVKYWQTRAPEAQIIHTDAARQDWSTLRLEHPAVCLSNLPYQIAASLVVELSSLKESVFDGLVLMFQKEVAERIQAKSGDEDYGMLSVVAQCAWQIERVVDAGPQDFFPVPNVGSRVLKFSAKNVAIDKSKLLSLVKLAFSQRRKKLISNLQAQFAKESLLAAFEKLQISESARAEDLSSTSFMELSKILLDLSDKA